MMIEADTAPIDRIVTDKPHIMIATPCRDGRVDVNYATSLMATGQVFASAGVPYASLHLIASGIDNGRNILAMYFLNGPCSHLLFVDDDMAWAADLPLRLLNENVDVVGVPCRKKIKRAEYTVKHGTRIGSVEHRPWMVLVDGIGMGMTMIRRNVFEKMKQNVPLYHCYSSKYASTHMFFRHELIVEEGIQKYESEDFHFCRLARKEGFNIFAYVDEDVPHIGRQVFRGPYNETIGLDVPHKFTSDRQRLCVNLTGFQ